MRNKEMMVGHLETWADALEALKDIGENRMPTVADMLASAAQAKSGQKPSQPSPPSPSDPNAKSGPMAGNNRSDQTAEPKESKPDPNAPDMLAVPKLTDVESGHMKTEEATAEEEPQKPGQPKFGLPTTVLNGGPKPEKQDEDPAPAEDQVDEAVEEQADLLADFAKVRDDLQKIMDDLENSTFVKRFKAASRRQLEVAEDLNRTLFKGFGITAAKLDDRQGTQAEKIAVQEEAQSRSVWMIQTDLEAYYDRRKMPKFLRILDEMQELEVTTQLTKLGDRVRQNMAGEAIARTEYWGDTMDRWAEELVEPCPGGS